SVLRRGLRLRPALGPEVRLPRCLRVAMGRRAEEICLGTGGLHLCAAIHHPPALQRPRDVGGAADRDLQPHGQGDGLRLVRPDRECAGVLTSVGIWNSASRTPVNGASRVFALLGQTVVQPSPRSPNSLAVWPFSYAATFSRLAEVEVAHNHLSRLS